MRTIGHRGLAGLAPENTLAGFREAAAHGLPMVEFDVRLSRDGVPLVFHDDMLERTTNGYGPVAEHDWAELRKLDAGSWFAPAFAGEVIPSLEQVLRLCLDLGLAVNMEIKPDSGREVETARLALERAAALWPVAAQAPLVSSFVGACLAVARDLAPSWPRGLLVDGVPEDWRDTAALYCCSTVHADHRHLDQPRVAVITQAGYCVLAYTVNDRARVGELRQMGVGSVFSDFPHSS